MGHDNQVNQPVLHPVAQSLNNLHRKNLNFSKSTLIAGSIMTPAGIAAFAVSLFALNALSGGIVGLTVMTIGLAATLCGLILLLAGAEGYRPGEKPSHCTIYR